ncbi:hypothetical protein Fmac_021089 [Flemingia macrophylla]|uniref:Uncharacterized protein n=1 Tax=Flemingia macrophylla TaxID=520843 RepID=A0ABD1LW40_9FABA
MESKGDEESMENEVQAVLTFNIMDEQSMKNHDLAADTCVYGDPGITLRLENEEVPLIENEEGLKKLSKLPWLHLSSTKKFGYPDHGLSSIVIYPNATLSFRHPQTFIILCFSTHTNHCASTVPNSTPNECKFKDFQHGPFQVGYYVGGDTIVGADTVQKLGQKQFTFQI